MNSAKPRGGSNLSCLSSEPWTGERTCGRDARCLRAVMGALLLSLLCQSCFCLLLSAASTGEDLSLAISIPTNRAELNRGVRKAVDRFHPPLDDYSTVRTGTCCHRRCVMLLGRHDSSALYSNEYVDCRRSTWTGFPAWTALSFAIVPPVILQCYVVSPTGCAAIGCPALLPFFPNPSSDLLLWLFALSRSLFLLSGVRQRNDG